VILNAHSYYSLRYGVLSEKMLLDTFKSLGYDFATLTDINNTSLAMSFINHAKKEQMKPIIGIDFRNGTKQQFIGLAKTNKGFEFLNRFLSKHLTKDKQFESRAPETNEAFFIYPWNGKGIPRLRENEYVGIQSNQLSKLKFSKVYNKWKHKLVLLFTSTFRTKKDFNTHRLLRAIDNNVLLSKLEPEEVALESDKFKDRLHIEAECKDFYQLIENTRFIIESCELSFDFGKNTVPKNKSSFTKTKKADIELLSRLIEEGIAYRYGQTNHTIVKRIENELQIINAKGFVSYFLINWDILRYAREKSYFYVGRGSGANSLIAYLLRITDVDPIELDLYFERFINLFRENPPDFDIDFSWKDREDITRYIFERYGEEHTALLATYNTFQVRAAVRELGKVFGLPKEEIDTLSKEFPRFHFGRLEGEKSRIPKTVGSTDHLIELVLKYASYIEGFPNYLGIHAGGILISEEPIYAYSALSLPPKGWNTVQFDMVVAEDIGLYKFDILSQRGLGHIKDAIGIIRENNPKDKHFDIHDIESLKKDEKIKDLIRAGKTLGCFYVESPAMRMLLTKLKADTYLGLVAASSIIRPGVAKSGMMREYILRHRNPKRMSSVNKTMLEIMPETYGIMVYQEDVIKVAHHFAGLSLAEADVLRRGMSGKYRSKEEFRKVKEQFFSNCDKMGKPKKLTEEIWFQIESFAGYSFSKGHSASYAVESYQSLYLKAYYPREFMVAVINNFGGFYRTETYVHELRMAGAKITAPCINQSKYVTSIKGRVVYLGFIHVKDLEVNFVYDFLSERENNGTYRSLRDFINRNATPKEQLLKLIQIGAFSFTTKTKKELFWEAHMLLPHSRSVKKGLELFESNEEKEWHPAKLEYHQYEDAFDEMELLGFTLANPFELLKNSMDSKISAKQLKNHLGKVVAIYGYLVHTKYTHAKGKKLMYFGTFIDKEDYFFDTVHFPQIADKYRFRGKGIYKTVGKVVAEFGFISIEVISMEKQAFISDPKYDP
jgi:error-prone DNA polymerase